MVGDFIFVRPEQLLIEKYIDEVKIKCSALFVPPELKPGFLLLLIVLPSSPTIGNTHVGCWAF